MFAFFDFIVDLISTAVDFVVNLFKMLLFMITFIVQGFAYVGTCLVYLPPWVLPFISAVIAFSVIMFLINR